MLIEKLLPKNHRRGAQLADLPRNIREAVIQKAHEIVVRWKQAGKAITRSRYALAWGIARDLVLHPRGPDWGCAMSRRKNGQARMRQLRSQRSEEDLKKWFHNGWLCSRTIIRTKKAKEQQQLQGDIDRQSGVGEDGVIPRAWYEKNPASLASRKAGMEKNVLDQIEHNLRGI